MVSSALGLWLAAPFSWALVPQPGMILMLELQVKNYQTVFCMVMSSWCSGPAEEPEPGNSTVDPADIRGLAPT